MKLAEVICLFFRYLIWIQIPTLNSKPYLPTNCISYLHGKIVFSRLLQVLSFNTQLYFVDTQCIFTSVDDDIELLAELHSGGGVAASDLSSSLFSDDFRTAPTRSLAIRDHDSSRLWANQQAAGPRPPPFMLSNMFFTLTSGNVPVSLNIHAHTIYSRSLYFSQHFFI